MTLKICHVWDYEYPWDVRVEKVSRALTDAGHEVHLTARNRGRLPEVETIEGVATVHRLASTPWMGKKLEAAVMFPAFFNPRWARHIRRVAEDTRADVILVRDLPLTPTAIWVGKQMGLPVIHDMAENYGAMIRDLWLTRTTRFGDVLVRNPAIVDRIEQWCLPRLDHVVVVVEESADRLAALGTPRDKITVVSNTPPRIRAAIDRPGRDAAKPLELVYLGLMEQARGVGAAIEAFAECRRQEIPMHMTLVGDGRNLDDFKALAATEGLTSEDVDFLGFVQNEKALEIVAAADIGLIPHHVNESWNTTIPNKLFDYMAAGLVVVASNAVPVERVLRETGAGEVFRDRDTADLTRVLAQLASDPDLERYQKKGQEAVRAEFNWEADTARLLSTMEAMVR